MDNIELFKKFAEYIKHADPIIQAHEKRAADDEARRVKIAALAGKAADRYVESGYVPQGLRDKTAASLADHATVLEIFYELASRPADIPGPGKPANVTKQASDGYSPFLSPAEPRETEADRRLLARLGLA